MSQLSAKAEAVLTYSNAHKIDGFAEIGDDIGLPDHVVISACRELKSAGCISDFEENEESVEYIRF